MADYKAVYETIVGDERYLKNLDWGVPRPGHPEGTVRAHLAEIETNLEKLRPKLAGEDYWKLKVLIHTHDTFKREATSNVAIVDPKSHASLAREFLASFCDDADLLAIVQWHDEPFALWRQVKHKGKCNADRLNALFDKIKDWNLFLAFNIIDGCTAGKDRKPLRWLLETAKERVNTTLTAADIISE